MYRGKAVTGPDQPDDRQERRPLSLTRRLGAHRRPRPLGPLPMNAPTGKHPVEYEPSTNIDHQPYQTVNYGLNRAIGARMLFVQCNTY
jgi:hypothetical protein